MQKAIVTGQSRGLGAAIAAELLARGIPVLGLARQVNAGLAEQFGSACVQIPLDLANTAELSAWLASDALPVFAAGASELILVNNAGVLGPMAALGAQEGSETARAVALNVTAPLLCSDALRRSGCARQRIVHISSGAGRDAYPGWSIYGATKAALDHHARAVAKDDLHGLRICSLAPGVIDTDMQGEIRHASAEDFPLRDKFVSLKESGGLISPATAASRLVTYVLSERFGGEPVADLRQCA